MFHLDRMRAVIAGVALVGALAFVAVEADAKVSGGGSRGSRTFSAPPVTQTAPKPAAPIERSMTQPQRPGTVGQAQTAPAQGGLFGGRFGGLGGALLGGFIGAGLFGLLSGSGLFSGLSGGGFASFLGLLLQVGLVVIVGRLLWSWWQRRQAGAYATAGGPAMRDLSSEPMRNGAMGGGSGPVNAGGDIAIGEDDFNTFESRLAEIQSAFGAEDLAKLRKLVTPEMLSYFAEDLAANSSRGVVNEISDVKLLQGDLAEAWREDNSEYASVAMRFSLVDIMRERASGKVVSGSGTPEETTQIWTFLRAGGGDWILSAIQDA